MPAQQKAEAVVCHIMQTPNSSRQDRIKYLRKQEDRKRRLPDLLTFLTDVSGQPITETDVLSIDKTDEIWTNVRNCETLNQTYFSVSFPYRDKAKLTTVFKALQSSLSGQKQFFTTHKYQDTCLLLVDTTFCVDNYDKIIEFDGDTFYIYDNELKNGLWIDTNEEHWTEKQEYLWTYELRVRGLDWIDKVYNIYRQLQTI